MNTDLTLKRPLIVALLGTTMVGCSLLGAPPHERDGKGSSGGDGDSGGTTGTSGTSGSSTGIGEVPDPLPDGTDGGAILPARIRRLTNAEYNATVQALIGTTLSPADTFPPDTRQHGFSVNEAQRIDPVLARQLDKAASDVADEVVARLDEFAPCADSNHSACADSFITDFGKDAYRRPLSDEDVAALVNLFEAGYSEGVYAEGIHLVVRGMLQSPGFLYHTELGDGTESGTVRMSPYEIASSLSYLLTGAPPEDSLVAVAESGGLDTPEGRATEARRMLGSAAGQNRAVRVVREWLGIDRIVNTAKDATVYEEYEGLRASMHKETEDFVKAVLSSSGGDVSELLGAPWTVAEGDLAGMYGANGAGRVDVPERPGLLNRGAFLSVYAHAHETSPVLRGTAVLRRVACEDIELPSNLAVSIVPPASDPNATTRERFSQHTEDAVCAECHNKIDPIGFSFEQFDGMGMKQTTENGFNIDSNGDVSAGFDFDGSYGSSTELAAVLAQSETVRTCFARQLFRANVGEGVGAEDSEEAFVSSWGRLGAAEQTSLIEILIHLSTTDLSIYRSEP